METKILLFLLTNSTSLTYYILNLLLIFFKRKILMFIFFLLLFTTYAQLFPASKILTFDANDIDKFIEKATLMRPKENPSLEEKLISASKKGDSQLVLTLLKRDIDPNTRDSSKYTPLHHAAKNGHIETVRVLLQYNADPTIEGIDYFDFLQYVFKSKDINGLKNLKTHTPIDLVDEDSEIYKILTPFQKRSA